MDQRADFKFKLLGKDINSSHRPQDVKQRGRLRILVLFGKQSRRRTTRNHSNTIHRREAMLNRESAPLRWGGVRRERGWRIMQFRKLWKKMRKTKQNCFISKFKQLKAKVSLIVTTWRLVSLFEDNEIY